MIFGLAIMAALDRNLLLDKLSQVPFAFSINNSDLGQPYSIIIIVDAAIALTKHTYVALRNAMAP
jgi:hypothetical protein